MSKENNGIKALLLILLTFCLLAIAMFFSVLKKDNRPISILPSENERFLVLQQKYIQNLEQTITQLLEPLVGPGNVRVAVQLDLNLKNIRSGHHNQTTNDTGKSASFTNTSEKQIQNLIQKQHISVVVNGSTPKGVYKPRTTQEIATYRRLVQSAVGHNANRGDTLEVQNMPFVAPVKKQTHLCSLQIFAGLLMLFSIGFIIFSFFCCCHPNKDKKTKNTPHFSTDILTYINENPARAVAVIKNWIYMPANPKDTDWAPIQKVGIILLALDEAIVRQILIALDDNEVRQVAKTMTTLGVIPPQESTRILSELYNAMKNGSAVVGNPARVQQILSESDNIETLKFKETLQPSHSSLWQELANTNTDTLAPRLSALRPETAAFILYRLPTEKASDILQNFPETKATQVLIHLSHIGHISNNTSAKMEQDALNATREILNTIHMPSGTEKTSEILSQLAQTHNGQAVIHELNEKEPFLIKKLTTALVHFENLSRWSPTTIQTILRNTPKTTALMAFAKAPKDIKRTIQQNVPPSLWEELNKQIEIAEKTLSDHQIQDARQKIVEIVRDLITQGKIQI